MNTSRNISKPVSPAAIGRRSLLKGAAAAAFGASMVQTLESMAGACEIGPLSDSARREKARQIRIDMAEMAYARPLPTHECNGDEEAYPNRIGNYSKCLPHNSLGEVDQDAYNHMLAVLADGRPSAFEDMPLAGARRLTNPQAGVGFDLEGADGHSMTQPPAPLFASAECAGEMVELYWMALLRDVPFTRFEDNEGVAAACGDLSHLSDFRGPKEQGRVTPRTLFRGFTDGDLAGPFVSQFMWKPIPYGALTIDQRMRTVLGGIDYMTTFPAWLNIQNGGASPADRFEWQTRYIRNMRDLCQWVHVDALYEGYLNACLILLGLNAPLDPGNPYVYSRTQIGFGTFGGPHILSLVTEVATRALKAVWFQKWFVHRRLRPEAFGARVHNNLTNRTQYPIHGDVLGSEAVEAIHQRYGSFLLPQAYPEGCPTHPSYGAGHATVAGACVTILKAWFDESAIMPHPVVANAQGTSLIPYQGSDKNRMTVGGELNKVAANVAIARSMAGIHWRSDYVESVKLGEQLAIDILQEQMPTCNEAASFSLTKFNGETIRIS